MAAPLLTILTPVKNGARYLKECLDSVEAARKAGITIEHIFIDGASTDGTLDMLAVADAIVFVKPELTPIECLEFALAHVTGEYVLLVMADDVLSPDFATLFQNLLAQNPKFELALFACRAFSDESARVISPPRRIWTILNKYPGMNSALMRRDVLERARFPTRYYLSNDRPLMLRLWSCAEAIIVSDAVLTGMRLHPKSLTNSPLADINTLSGELTRLGLEFADANKNAPAGALFLAYAWRRAFRHGFKEGSPPLSSLALLPLGLWRLARHEDALKPKAPLQGGVEVFTKPYAFAALSGGA